MRSKFILPLAKVVVVVRYADLGQKLRSKTSKKKKFVGLTTDYAETLPKTRTHQQLSISE